MKTVYDQTISKWFILAIIILLATVNGQINNIQLNLQHKYDWQNKAGDNSKFNLNRQNINYQMMLNGIFLHPNVLTFNLQTSFNDYHQITGTSTSTMELYRFNAKMFSRTNYPLSFGTSYKQNYTGRINENRAIFDSNAIQSDLRTYSIGWGMPASTFLPKVFINLNKVQSIRESEVVSNSDNISARILNSSDDQKSSYTLSYTFNQNSLVDSKAHSRRSTLSANFNTRLNDRLSVSSNINHQIYGMAITQNGRIQTKFNIGNSNNDVTISGRRIFSGATVQSTSNTIQHFTVIKFSSRTQFRISSNYNLQQRYSQLNKNYFTTERINISPLFQYQNYYKGAKYNSQTSVNLDRRKNKNLDQAIAGVKSSLNISGIRLGNIYLSISDGINISNVLNNQSINNTSTFSMSSNFRELFNISQTISSSIFKKFSDSYIKRASITSRSVVHIAFSRSIFCRFEQNRSWALLPVKRANTIRNRLMLTLNLLRNKLPLSVGVEHQKTPGQDHSYIRIHTSVGYVLSSYRINATHEYSIAKITGDQIIRLDISRPINIDL